MRYKTTATTTTIITVKRLKERGGKKKKKMKEEWRNEKDRERETAIETEIEIERERKRKWQEKNENTEKKTRSEHCQIAAWTRYKASVELFSRDLLDLPAFRLPLIFSIFRFAPRWSFGRWWLVVWSIGRFVFFVYCLWRYQTKGWIVIDGVVSKKQREKQKKTKIINQSQIGFSSILNLNKCNDRLESM